MPSETAIDPIAEAHRQWVAHGWGDVADGMALVTSMRLSVQPVTEEEWQIICKMGGVTP